MSDLIPVRVRECPDGTHPEGDHVFILPKLGLEGGIAARQDLAEVRRLYPITSADISDAGEFVTEAGRAYDAALVRRWMVTFCRYGAVSWELHDEGGEVWPFDVSRLLGDAELGFVVADRADDFYRESVMRPLLERARQTSRSGATGSSTSRPTTSTGKRRARSSRPATAGPQSPAPTA
jgi:hypothetical protein